MPRPAGVRTPVPPSEPAPPPAPGVRPDGGRPWSEAPPPVRRKQEPAPAQGPTTATEGEPLQPQPSAGTPEADAAPSPAPNEPTAAAALDPALYAAPALAAPQRYAALPPPADGTEKPAETGGRRRRAKNARILVGIIALVVAIGLSAAFVIPWLLAQSEGERFAQARTEYQEGKFQKAAEHLHQLADEFPDSEHAAEYRFLADVSDLRALGENLTAPPEDVLTGGAAFLGQYAGNALLKEYAAGPAETFDKLALALADSAAQSLQRPVNVDGAERFYALAGRARDLARRFPAPETPARARATAELTEVLPKIQTERKRQEVLAWAKRQPPTVASLEKVRKRFESVGVQGEPEAKQILNGIHEQFLANVTYTPVDAPLTAPAAARAATVDAELLIVTPAPTSGGPTGGSDEVLFARARGVLYALTKAEGRVLWATRVGMEGTAMPVRYAPGPPAAELALVLSRDGSLLSAREAATGRTLWQYELPTRCSGAPVLVGDRAYVATRDGSVHEIDVPAGRLRGTFDLHAALGAGGTWQKGTNLVYFPADKEDVFVLDVAQHRCAGVLFSGHPGGSLRGPPLVIGEGGPGSEPRAGFLVLSQSDGIASMRLRVYPLPVQGVSESPPVTPEFTIPGWSWFPPYSDGEKLAVATDAGSLGLFGLNQPNDQDAPLFRLAPDDSPAPASGGVPQRNVVVHGIEHDLWVVSQGALNRYHMAIERGQGLELSRVWSRPVPVGSPLQPGDVNRAGDTLYVVTESPGTRQCLVTAVDETAGLSRWQRSLGMVCPRDPVALGGRVLAVDEGGAVYGFEPGRTAGSRRWQVGGDVRAQPLDGIVYGPVLQTRPDGSVVEIAGYRGGDANASGPHYRLVFRSFGGDGGRALEKEFPLPSPPAGRPGIGADYLILALRSGDLYRQPFEGEARPGGVSWRGRTGHENARGHVAVLDGDEFLTTDGSRGVSRWHWPADGLPREIKSVELPEAIAFAPLVLAGSEPDARIVVAGARGTLFLLDRGDLHVVRRWTLGGPISAEPALRGKYLACVVGRNRLVWIDPARDKPVWEFAAPEQEIVGRPQLVHGAVLVADLSGRFTALDPETGKPRGKGFRLTEGVPPAAAPAALGPDKVFAPLADGTAVIISARHFR